MTSISFELDFWAFVILALIGSVLFLIWRWSQQFGLPHFLFSDLQDLKSAPTTWRARFPRLTQWLGYTALAAFSLAFLDPRFYLPTNTDFFPTPTKGIAIYLVLDQSSSMNQQVVALNPSGTLETIKKTELLKTLTKDFVSGNPKTNLKGRPNDILGLIFFARTAHVISPLTLDHNTILNEISRYHTVQDKNEDGTAIGYAIYKTANLIAATKHFSHELEATQQPAYDIKNAIVILVTDGFHDPNPQDDNNPLRSIGIMEAAQYAKEKGVRVYVINIEPTMTSEKYAPNRRQMQQATELTGGHFYILDSTTRLDQIYADIDKLEKSILPTERIAISSKDELPYLYRRVSFYPFLIGIGMLAMALSIIVKTVFMRQIP